MANTRVTTSVTDFDKTNTTQGLKLPSGTNSNQPIGVDAIQGMLRNDTDETVNSSASTLTHYDGTQWKYFAASVSAAPYSFEYLAVAGGGGGGGGAVYANGGGGGGAGGYYTATSGTLDIGTEITITIGNGGTAGPNSYTTQLAGSGGDTIVTHVKSGTLTCSGGGGGASGDGSLSGANGGSGGGGKTSGTGGLGVGFTGEQVADAGDGATGTGGGGGGAGQTGFDANPTTGGGADGGDGLSSSITGTATYYAGGGGGAGYYFGNPPGGQSGSGANLTPKGGLGGGGNASINSNTGLTSPQNGTDGLGGGGGARNCWNNAGTGGRGGSGVVIFKIASSDYSGTITGSPDVDTTSVSGYTILKFTGSGSYTV